MATSIAKPFDRPGAPIAHLIPVIGVRVVTPAAKTRLLASLVDALGILPGCTGDQAAAQAAAENCIDEALWELIDEVQRQLRRGPPPAQLRLVSATA